MLREYVMEAWHMKFQRVSKTPQGHLCDIFCKKYVIWSSGANITISD